MSKLALYRCQNSKCAEDADGRLIFDFALSADQLPVCPKCGCDIRKYPNLVIERKLIHYDPPHPVIGERGQRCAACDPALKWEGSDHVGFTGAPGAVTCPNCMATDVWKQHAIEQRVRKEYDFTVEVDPKTKTVKHCRHC